MKKFFLYIIIIVILAFLFPIFFTKKFITEDVSAKSEEEIKTEEQEKYEYQSYGEINVLHTVNNEIEKMSLDEYLLGVVSAEMPVSFEEEALKAQAIVARTYTIYTIKNSKGKHGDADICDDSKCCQAWISKEDRLNKWDENKREENWNKIQNVVYSTQGKIIVYDNEPIDAFFHSNSGGKTEEVSNVWGGTDLPYLKSVQTSGEEAYTQYSSEVTISKVEFEEKIKERYPDFYINYSENECIKILEYTNGDRVKTIKIGNLNLSGVEVRTLLGLRSANFEFYINEEELKFSVKGYGHGVGMSQTGADALAKEEKKYDEIIKHFYTNVEIVNI